jgi:hypothetical protein
MVPVMVRWGYERQSLSIAEGGENYGDRPSRRALIPLTLLLSAVLTVFVHIRFDRCKCGVNNERFTTNESKSFG